MQCEWQRWVLLRVTKHVGLKTRRVRYLPSRTRNYLMAKAKHWVTSELPVLDLPAMRCQRTTANFIKTLFVLNAKNAYIIYVSPAKNLKIRYFIYAHNLNWQELDVIIIFRSSWIFSRTRTIFREWPIRYFFQILNNIF